jgi:diguanylate cyclase (GGDEF)-like protein/PAS domain S-box-containing protein
MQKGTENKDAELLNNGKSLPCEELLPAVLNASTDGIFTVVPTKTSFRISHVNAAIERILPNIAEGKTISQVLPTEDARWLKHKIKSVIHNERSGSFTIKTGVFYGKDRPILLTLTPIKHKDTWNVIGIIRDVNEADDIKTGEKANKDRFALALEYAPYGVCFVGPGNTPTMVNQSLGRLLNKSLSTLREMQVESFINEEDKPIFAQALRKVIYKGCAYRDIEVRLATEVAEGEEPVWASISMSKVAEDEDNSYLIIQFMDISKRKQLEAELVQQATRDHLTTLSNRMVFEDALRLALKNSRRYGRHGAVLYIDLDEFKSINDTYGHKAGDSALVAVGQTLRTYLRETDIIARLGGDEFAVILDEVDEEEAVHKAELVEAAVNQIRVTAHGAEVKVSCSVGYYVFDGSEILSIDDVVARADRSMYQSKESKAKEDSKIQLVS